jgi:hypothetical protein
VVEMLHGRVEIEKQDYRKKVADPKENSPLHPNFAKFTKSMKIEHGEL